MFVNGATVVAEDPVNGMLREVSTHAHERAASDASTCVWQVMGQIDDVKLQITNKRITDQTVDM